MENNYNDITQEWLNFNSNKTARFMEMQSYKRNGISYKVDGKHVVLKHSLLEKYSLEVISRLYNVDIYLLPAVNYPLGVSMPDCLIKGEEFDLKIPRGSSKNVLYGMIKGKSRQAKNFIFDCSYTPLSYDNIDRQIGEIYLSKHLQFVDKIIVVKDYKIYKVFNRNKKESNTSPST